MTIDSILALILGLTICFGMPVAMYGTLSSRRRSPRNQFGRTRRTRR